MDDQSDITTNADGPEVQVPCGTQLVKLHARARWIQLQIERRRLDGLLFIASQPREAVGESVCDAELH
jgi:hypothetical protein